MMLRRLFQYSLVLAACFLLLVLPVDAKPAVQVIFTWSEPEPISPSDEWSWFPTMTFDPFGQLHAIWCWTRPRLNEPGLFEQIKYSRLNSSNWENINDITIPSADIQRNSITSDHYGNLHLTFGGSAYGILEINYQNAPRLEAWSAAAWTTPERLNQGVSYFSAIDIDSQGNLHVIYDDTLHDPDEDPEDVVVSDIYYRKSSDGGKTWTWPLVLDYHPDTGSARPTLLVDEQDVIHVTWDEGWDRLSGQRSEEYFSVYIFSKDNGTTWSDPTEIHFPDDHNALLTVGSNNEEGVMLVWRSMNQDRIYYQWSENSGKSWSRLGSIPGIYAQYQFYPFNQYSMATDSDGNIHLLISGRDMPDPNSNTGIYHLIWDGKYWSEPIPIFVEEGLIALYPKAAIKNGNELHATWFTMEGNIYQDDTERVVWHSWSRLLASRQITTPWPTPSPTPTIQLPTSTSEPTATIHPNFNGEIDQISGNLPQSDPFSETDEIIILGIVLLPVILLIMGILIIRWFKNKR